MIDYKTFKKGYLTEWVDRSQAARKAAEELAMKDSTTLSDRYKEEGLVFFLDGHMVEFKGENEKNLKNPKFNLLTYKEAMERFGKPDKDGWRLPTYEELYDLYHDYPFEFDEDGKQCIFDKRLYLPAAGYRGRDGYVHDVGGGSYWSSTPNVSEEAWYLYFNSGEVNMYSYHWSYDFSVRLVRDVK